MLTEKIQKEYAEISYSLEESEPAGAKEEAKEKPKSVPKTSSTAKTHANKGQGSEGDDGSYDDDDEDSAEEGSREIREAGQNLDFRTSRLRSKADNQQDRVNEMEDRKSNQTKLHKLK